MAHVLVIDDDRGLCRSLEIQLSQKGHRAVSAHSAGEGLEAARNAPPDIVFCDLRLPDRDGLHVLRELREIAPECLAIIITGFQDTRATIEAVREGAFDYIRKPLDLDGIALVLEKAAGRLGATRARSVDVLPAPAGPREIIGADKKIVEVLKEIGLLSRSRLPVLIEGESGTGKELVARALHDATSPGRPFVAVNCSAVVPTLLESELFGHEKGAFTGADAPKPGKLELAGEGSIFFDEIADMAFDLQAKLLRALQEREFERVGGLETIPLCARVVAATNRSLDELVREGKFREDLYYRLAVSRLRLPALRERKGDIPLLVNHILGRVAPEVHKQVESIEETALELLKAYEWPGNVRELENVLTRALLLARGAVVTGGDVEAALGAQPAPAEAPNTPVVPLKEAERRCVLAALESAGWNITRTARILAISPTTLRKKIRGHELRRRR